jgi:hypothetical protein
MTGLVNFIIPMDNSMKLDKVVRTCCYVETMKRFNIFPKKVIYVLTREINQKF